MTKNYLILLLLSFFISCNSNNSNKRQTYGYEFRYVRNANLELDSSISPFFTDSQYLPSDEKIIAKNGKNTILVLDLKRDSIEKQIIYNNEGVDDVNGSSGNFYYHNKDSIFLLGANSRTYYLTNDNAEVLKSIKLQDVVKDVQPLGQPLINMSSSSALYQSELLTFVTYPTTANDIGKSLHDPVYVNFNIETTEIEKGRVSYKFNATKNLIQYPFHIHPLLSRNHKNEKVLVFRNNNIILTGENDSIFDQKKFKSDYFDEYTKMKSTNEMATYRLESFSNEKLLYNPQTGYSYLFISHAIDVVNSVNGKKNNPFSKPFSVVVFDKNFEKILEEKFPGDKYNLNASFISNDYLYLSLNNPENQSFDEDFFRFELYELQENKKKNENINAGITPK